MVLTPFLPLAALVFVAVSASPLERETVLDRALPPLLGVDWTEKGHYNAPVEPWKDGALPGWYLGKHPEKYPTVFHLSVVGINLSSRSFCGPSSFFEGLFRFSRSASAVPMHLNLI